MKARLLRETDLTLDKAIEFGKSHPTWGPIHPTAGNGEGKESQVPMAKGRLHLCLSKVFFRMAFHA